MKSFSEWLRTRIDEARGKYSKPGVPYYGHTQLPAIRKDQEDHPANIHLPNVSDEAGGRKTHYDAEEDKRRLQKEKDRLAELRKRQGEQDAYYANKQRESED